VERQHVRGNRDVTIEVWKFFFEDLLRSPFMLGVDERE